ncbi:MAG: MoxR family ATPase, partial [Kiritimatiellae bacterium]|nr:MoxR family ATPase [Kiritimatiellia bacterium]
GPVFTTFLRADEINRAPAKTQSALLQAMQERKVTIDRMTHDLSPNFTVFATQNPIEYEGTYPLPEAQKDRFMLKIVMDYPDREAERALALRVQGEDAPEALLARGALAPLIDAATLTRLRAALPAITLRPELLDYAVDLVRATRAADSAMTGAGPRATQAFVIGARAAAVIAGRDFVTPDDIRELAVPVLAHRLVLRPEYEVEGLTPAELVGRLLAEVPVPR